MWIKWSVCRLFNNKKLKNYKSKEKSLNPNQLILMIISSKNNVTRYCLITSTISCNLFLMMNRRLLTNLSPRRLITHRGNIRNKAHCLERENLNMRNKKAIPQSITLTIKPKGRYRQTKKNQSTQTREW